ncbi:MAG: hypothetical protein ACTHKT_04120 [Solirubrobacterales bacterium]
MVANSFQRNPRLRGTARRKELGAVSPTLITEKPNRQHREKTRAGPWLRARVFLSRLRFDRALAGGADPSASPELALRAEQLQSPKGRGRIARGIDRLIAIASADPRRHVGPSMLPFRHQRVRPNLDRFEELADVLRSAGSHSVKGVAMASTLLEDGRGPLYASDHADKLREALDATISEIQAEHDEGHGWGPRPAGALVA